MMRCIGGFILLFMVGYGLPNLFDLDKKMSFAPDLIAPNLQPCHWVNNSCIAQDFELILHHGNFAVLQRTSFTLTRHGQAISTPILVSSDDNQFGVLVAQQSHADKSEVLLPFCGNPIMKIIVIDQKTNSGVLMSLNNKGSIANSRG